METRKAGVLIPLEPGEVRKDVRVRPSPSPPINGEHSLMAKPHAVTVADTGSSPVVHPKFACAADQYPEARCEFIFSPTTKWTATDANYCGHSSTARIRRCQRRDAGWNPAVRTTVRDRRRERPHEPQCAGSNPALTSNESIAQLAEHPVLTREVARSILARFTKLKPGSSSRGAPLLQSGGWRASEARSADRRTKCELAKPAFQSAPGDQF